MMFNAKLMLLVVMLWTGSLTLASTGLANPVCELYELPENADWTDCEDNREFQCQPGYQSTVKTTCNINGKWDLEPSCQAVECPSGEKIDNSDTVTPSALYGADFNVDCSTGFTRNGVNGTLKCGESGNWIVTTACEAVECPSGEDIDNSDTVTPSGIYGADFNFKCLTGFTRNGLNGILKCGESGNWIVTTSCEDCYKYSSKELIDQFARIRSPEVVDSQATCDAWCDDSCTAHHMFSNNWCYVYKAPLIFYGVGVDPDDCSRKCTEMSECRTMKSYDTGCWLYSITLGEIADMYQPRDREPGTVVAEKLC